MSKQINKLKFQSVLHGVYRLHPNSVCFCFGWSNQKRCYCKIDYFDTVFQTYKINH